MAIATKAARERQDVLFELNRALWSLVAVRSREIPLEFELDDEQRLTIHGHTPTRSIKDEIVSVARTVAGIRDVDDQLVADPDLEIEVAEALAGDPRTKRLPPGSVSIFARLGAVVLVGELGSSERQAVLDVVRDLAQVGEITDRIKAVE